MTDKRIFQHRLKECLNAYASRTAIEYGTLRVSYRELAEQSENVVRCIRQEKIGPGSLIGIRTANRVRFIAAMTGILQAGCIFVPLDTAYPASRIDRMVRAIGLERVIGDEGLCRDLHNLRRLPVDDRESSSDTWPLPAVEYSSEDPVYIYFTSGSSGAPRAILGKNKSLTHFIDWEIETFIENGSSSVTRFSQFTSVGFDAFLRDVYVPLCCGGTICIPEQGEELLTSEQMIRFIDSQDIHLIHCVPSIFDLFNGSGSGSGSNGGGPDVKHFKNLKYILLSGEKIKPEKLRHWYDIFGSRVQLVNFYGPTETTMIKTYYPIAPEDVEKERIPIGKPMKGTRVLILDEHMKVCGRKIKGEIYIRTPYRTYGYFNDPELTDRLFVPNPYNDDPADLLYKTGDTGCLLPDGNIELIGRMDRQVKVRGVRIELEEIENRIIAYNRRPAAGNGASNDRGTATRKPLPDTCTRCVMPASYPEISFDESGVCSTCRDYDSFEAQAQNYFKSAEDFKAILARCKQDNEKRKNNGYDCMLLFSGGKDSSYVLYRLVEMGAKVLAFTFDNDHISAAAMENIERVTKRLNVDSIIHRSERMKEILVESLKEDHTVCTGCFKALTFISTKIAYDMGIGLVVTGLSRGQIFDTRLHNLFQQRVFDATELEEKMLHLRKMYFSTNDNTSKLLGIHFEADLLDKVNIVDYYRYDNTTAAGIKAYLQQRDRYWHQPEDTGFCSTNCLINDVGIHIHQRDLGYHNYAVPFSWDCRLGQQNREEALKDLQFQPDYSRLNTILEEIGYYREAIREAVVTDRYDNNGGIYLCAYLLCTDPADRSGDNGDDNEQIVMELKEYLEGQLPAYMIPQHFITLDRLPRTPSGKIDFPALPEPVLEQAQGTPDKPLDPLEAKLAQIWAEVLQIDKERLDRESRFIDIGGHSLNTMNLISRIHKEFDVRIALGEFFKIQTIERLADHIRRSETERFISIKHAEEKEYYSLSSAQKRVYIFQRMEPNDTSYNMTEIVPLIHSIGKENYERIILRIIDRHDSLRTTFQLVGDMPVQRIQAPGSVEFKVEEAEVEAAQKQSFIDNYIRPFDLTRAPLLRVALLGLKETGQLILIVDMHHIISDGISSRIVIEEFMALDRGETLEPLKFQYKDYSEWQNNQKRTGSLKQQKEFWLKQFEGEIPKLQLPTDYARPLLRKFSGETITFFAEAEQAEQLQQLARSEDTTLYVVLISIYTVFLARLSSQEDIIIGTPTAGRRHEDLQQIVGMFVNTLALRHFPSGDLPFIEFLRDVNRRTLECFENQDYQFEDIVEHLSLERDTSRNPLFDVLFALHNIDDTTQRSRSEVDVEAIGEDQFIYEEPALQFDLELAATEWKDAIKLVFEYNTYLFKPETVDRFVVYFKNLLAAVLADRETSICRLDVTPDEEKQRILETFSRGESVEVESQRFEQRVRDLSQRHPHRLAVIEGERSLTYEELTRRAQQVAAGLAGQGIRPGCGAIVGIRMERSMELLEAILGVMHAGAAYLPIDPSYPEERITFMLKDSNAAICLTASNLQGQAGPDANAGQAGNKPSHPTLTAAAATDLAYVIYTSGSTGTPKAVMVQHDHFVNVSAGWRRFYRLDSGEVRVLQLAAFSFDVFAGDLSRALFNGGSLVICPERIKTDIPALYHLLASRCITIVESVPSLILPLFDYIYNHGSRSPGVAHLPLQTLILGSDVCRREEFETLVSRFGDALHIVNSYGVTEAAIDSSCYRYDRSRHADEAASPATAIGGVDPTGSVPVGKPLANMSLYILDPLNRFQPVGVPGELYIGGRSVCRGYMNNVDYTVERYLPDPFSEAAGARMYRTGDLVRWRSSGDVEFLGRMDYQVKIKGYRIEPEEIENRLLQFSPGNGNREKAIDDAVVIVHRQENGTPFLAAYVVAKENLDLSSLNTYLRRHLPDHMVPAHLMKIDELPLNPNGKILRSASLYPEPDIEEDIGCTPPGSELEEQLVSVWAEVLGMEEKRIGIETDFFRIGGDSIKTIQVSARLLKLNLKLDIKDFFLNPTIRGLSRCIKPVERLIDQSPVIGQVRLTPIQQWFFTSNFSGSQHYNQYMLLHSAAGFDGQTVRTVFDRLVEHHDALRMVFPLEEGKRLQQNRQPGCDGYDFVTIDLTSVEEDSIEQELRTRAAHLHEGIDLEKGPLVRLGLFKSSSGDYLLVAIHHLVIDGYSWQVLLEDFQTAYNQSRDGQEVNLPPKTDSYKTWAEKLYQYAAEPQLMKEAIYWNTIEKADVPALPKDRPCQPGSRTKQDNRRISAHMDRQQTRDLLTRANQAFNTEINDLLLTALGLSLKAWAGIDRCLVNLESHGRELRVEEIDVSRTVGWFTAEFPLLLNMSQPRSLDYHIKYTKETLRNIPARGTGYGMLKYITPTEKTGLQFRCQPEISFNYLGQWGQQDRDAQAVQESPVGAVVFDMGISESPLMQEPYALDINGMVIDGKLNISFGYNTREYDHETVKSLADLFTENLREIVALCSGREESELTPGDLGYSGLGIEEFESLEREIAGDIGS